MRMNIYVSALSYLNVEMLVIPSALQVLRRVPNILCLIKEITLVGVFLQSNMDKIFDLVKNHDPFTKFFHDASGSKEEISQDLTEERNQQKIAEKRQKKIIITDDLLSFWYNGVVVD
jgi:hypothetical protein